MNTLTTVWLDITLIVLLLASITFGYHQGLVRQTVLLISIYISTVLSAQYHSFLATFMLKVFPSTAPEITSLIAFLAMSGCFTVAVTWMLWTAYCETRLPSVVMLDELGGAVLGGVIGVFVLSLMLMLIRYSLLAPWPEGSPLKGILYTGMLNSMLQPAFSSPLPLVYAALRPWLPSDLPFILGS